MSDHPLPQHYHHVSADYEIGPHENAHGDSWLDAVNFMARRFGKQPSGYLKTQLGKVARGEAAQAERKAVEETKAQSTRAQLEPYFQKAAGAIADPSSRSAGWLRSAREALWNAGAPRDLVDANQPAIIDWLGDLAREKERRDWSPVEHAEKVAAGAPITAAALQHLREGEVTRFANGERYTLSNGVPVRVPDE